ncbi:MAG: type II toxin-antitoxin system RelE/ParE family toxin [Chloroflexi bacterium]|nr:type II toxin-antitoxin system RelE/ParE family toxin [Chloroflexota bacterium]
MTTRPVVLRERAQRDVEEAVEHYRAEASAAVALDFVDALEAAFRLVGEHPAAGSPRYARELDLPGLRSRLVPGFPYVVCYVERDADVDVWRVLHTARDISAWLREPAEE